MIINLPDDKTAVLRDPRKLTEGQSEALEDVQFELLQLDMVQNILKNKGLKGFEEIQDADANEQIATIGLAGFKLIRKMRRVSVLTYVKSWDFGDKVDMETLLDVPAETVRDIFEQIGKVIKAVGAPKLNLEVDPDPESPTQHSGD